MFAFYLLSFSRWAKTRCFWALQQIHFTEYLWIFVSCSNFFLKLSSIFFRNFPFLETSEVERKEQHYRLQSRHARKLFGVNVANCRLFEISRRTIFETTVQVIEFLTELHNVEISPVTLLKSNSTKEALLAIFCKIRKLTGNISGEVSFQYSYRY